MASRADCANVKAWSPYDAWTTYSKGSLRTNSNKLWQCKEPAYATYEPSGLYGYYGWTNLGTCSTVIDGTGGTGGTAGSGGSTIAYPTPRNPNTFLSKLYAPYYDITGEVQPTPSLKNIYLN